MISYAFSKNTPEAKFKISPSVLISSLVSNNSFCAWSIKRSVSAIFFNCFQICFLLPSFGHVLFLSHLDSLELIEYIHLNRYMLMVQVL